MATTGGFRTRSQVPLPAAGAAGRHPVLDGVPRIKLDSGIGRLYVTGPDRELAASLPGAASNERRGAIEVSLRLETLRKFRQRLGLTQAQFLTLCSEKVSSWIRAAVSIEAQVADVHAAIERGERATLPWQDAEEGLPPFDHQQVMATVALALDGVAFICEMGTGKTRGALESIAEQLRRENVTTVLVVCPRGVMGTWEREAARWTPGLPVTRLEGTVKERAALVRQMALDGHRGVVVTNYEVLAALQEPLQALVRRGQRLGLVFDEMHRIKNPDAQMTKAALQLATLAVWRLGMTGTPIALDIRDVWSQWFVLDWGIGFGGNYAQYKREFMEVAFDGDLVMRRGADVEVGLVMAKRGVRYKKEDCLDLPPKLYEIIEVDMTTEQRTMYGQMARELLASWDADTTISAESQAMRAMRLAQLASGVIEQPDGRVLRLATNPKLSAVKELVSEHIRDHQILVWAFFRAEHDMLMEALQEFRPRLIRGGVKFSEREEIEAAVRDGSCRLVIGSPGAAGVGLNFQAVSLAIYYSNWHALVERVQSEDRCHRAGSERHEKVTYIDLVMRGSVDRQIVESLRRKKSTADFILDVRAHLEATLARGSRD